MYGFALKHLKENTREIRVIGPLSRHLSSNIELEKASFVHIFILLASNIIILKLLDNVITISYDN
jgi:hypothetical protein